MLLKAQEGSLYHSTPTSLPGIRTTSPRPCWSGGGAPESRGEEEEEEEEEEKRQRGSADIDPETSSLTFVFIPTSSADVRFCALPRLLWQPAGLDPSKGSGSVVCEGDLLPFGLDGEH